MPPNVVYPATISKTTAEVCAALLIERNPNELHIPLVGDYRSALALRSRGFPAEKIHCYDVSLYASVIGFLADKTKKITDLEIQLDVPWPVEPVSDLQLGAHAILAMKYEQVKPLHSYNQNIRREMRVRWQQYLTEIENELQHLVDALGPISYEIMDHRDVMEAVADVKGAAIFLSPPPFKPASYRKAFPYDQVRWIGKLPLAWTKYALQEITDTLTGVPCFALVYTGENGAPLAWDNVLGLGKKKGQAEFLSANQPMDMARIEAKVSSKEPVRFEIYDDQEITEDTKLTFVEIDKETALYYRDLFIHRLGVTVSEMYLAMLLDGRLVTVIGINHARFMHHRTDYVSETFGISKSSHRYKRLGKLFMLALTTTEFSDFIKTHLRIGIRKPRGISTTSLTKHPEGKTDRGVMKVKSRVQLEDGTWKIVYVADFREETFQDALAFWLKKHGKQSREIAA